MYCARFGCLLRGNWGFFEQKKTKAAKHPSRSRTQKNSLCFLRLLAKAFGVAFCQSRLAKSLRRDRKTNPPADFSPAGGNLFNVSSVGLDREPARRAVAGAVGGLWPLGKASEGLVGIALKGPGTVNQRAQCHINRAPISGDIIYSFRVHRHLAGVVNIGAVQRAAYEKEIGAGAAGAPAEGNGGRTKGRSWRRAKHHCRTGWSWRGRGSRGWSRRRGRCGCRGRSWRRSGCTRWCSRKMEGRIRIAVHCPGTVNLGTQCHINRAPISGDIIYRF